MKCNYSHLIIIKLRSIFNMVWHRLLLFYFCSKFLWMASITRCRLSVFFFFTDNLKLGGQLIFWNTESLYKQTPTVWNCKGIYHLTKKNKNLWILVPTISKFSVKKCLNLYEKDHLLNVNQKSRATVVRILC